MGGYDINIIDKDGEMVEVTDHALDVAIKRNFPLEEAQDASKAIATIDVEHWLTHLGKHFFDGRVLEIPANQTWYWVVEVGANRPHMTFEVSPTNGGVAIITYEGITANEDGTLITPLNNNREATNLPTTKFRLNPTGISTASATYMRGARIGTVGGIAQRSGGNLYRSNELAFKRNTKYLLVIQNLNNDVCYVNLLHQLYEV